MDDTSFEIQQVKVAFRKLKRLVYYDKANLILRRRLARFENNPEFPQQLEKIVTVLNSKKPENHILFKNWLTQVSYFITSKKLEAAVYDREEDAKFITNLTTFQKYNVKKVNYFFDGPIELQIIAVIWLMKEGHILDKNLGPECYGARLEKSVGEKNDKSADLYRRYHELYKRWRDRGIAKAKDMLTQDGESVCILGLDVREYYYNVRIDYTEITEEINSSKNTSLEDNKSSPTSGKLLNLLKLIAEIFNDKIAENLILTHPSLLQQAIGLPIGLVSSPLLADWYLKKFDFAIKEEVRPAYYGRYVDDIFIVVGAPKKIPEKRPIETFLNNLLVRTNVLKDNNDGSYEITSRPGLFLEKSKCILQHFDVGHSIAGLEKFQKKLEENGSDFLLMPVDEGESSLEDVAYDILYDGSVNKFRSIKGISENRYELSKHLSRQTMLHLLTDDKPNPLTSESLISFFKGRNAIEFSDIWEKVFTFFHVSKDAKNFLRFEKMLFVEISRVTYSHIKIAGEVKEFLKKHLIFSRDMALSLGSEEQGTVSSRSFRKSNLLRHHFVRVPLTNYTNHKGSLTTTDVPSDIALNIKKMDRSPRFVNFDECMLFLNCDRYRHRNTNINIKNQFKAATKIFERINQSSFSGINIEEPDGGDNE